MSKNDLKTLKKELLILKNFLTSNWIMVVLALITIIGLVTGKYLFLFLAIPFGFNLFGKKKDKD